ncbi:MAG: GntR family transcriptional regulator [Actinomycetaceae bacterium]|nr:GntR family transcriptional regulator [Actinomycetaceae bacterium]
MVDHVTPLMGDGLVFEQIAEGIRHEILDDLLPGGAQVMSVSAYAAAHRINPATIQRAFVVLVDEGLLEKRRGIGTFVVSDAKERLLKNRRATFAAQVLCPAIAQAFLLGFDRQEIQEMISTCISEGEKK